MRITLGQQEYDVPVWRLLFWGVVLFVFLPLGREAITEWTREIFNMGPAPSRGDGSN